MEEPSVGQCGKEKPFLSVCMATLLPGYKAKVAGPVLCSLAGTPLSLQRPSGAGEADFD